MNMIEDYEGLSDFRFTENRDRLLDSELSYIEEVLLMKDDTLLAERIDELNGKQPPKAIDADKEIADLIEPIREEINPIYLEAPQDNVQIEQISDVMTQTEGMDYSDWKEFSLEERKAVLQNMENEIATIAHRPVCIVDIKSLGENNFGYYNPQTNHIVINSDYLYSNLYSDYKECLDTLIHEGRHAYQSYNLTIREVHPRQGDLTNWKSNEYEYGYQDARTCGFAAYYLQPQEADARAFAEDVLKSYQEKQEKSA